MSFKYNCMFNIFLVRTMNLYDFATKKKKTNAIVVSIILFSLQRLKRGGERRADDGAGCVKTFKTNFLPTCFVLSTVLGGGAHSREDEGSFVANGSWLC